MTRTEAQTLRTRLAQQTRHLGPDHPATVRTRRQLLLAKVTAELAKVDLSLLSEAEFRRLMDTILDARGSAGGSAANAVVVGPAPGDGPGVAQTVGAYDR
jgi:hypothetical protein